MRFSIRRVLGVAVVATVVGVASVAAQAAPASPPPPSPLTVSGVGYAQYLYQLKDSAGAGNQNQFSVQRAYINVIGKFSGGVMTRVTVDIAPTGTPATNQLVRLKYAYAAWTPGKSILTYKLGLIHTPWLDWEEALWDYRMQGTMAIERNGYLTSADFGAGIDIKGKDDVFNGQLVVVNGEGYSGGTGDKRKDVQGRLSFRVLKTNDNSRVGGLRVTGYFGAGKYTGGGDRNRYIGLVSYRTKMLTLAAEYASTKDTVSPSGGGNNATGSVISAYGVVHAPKSPVSVIARVDIADPNTSTATNKQTRYIAGISYQVTANLRVLGDVDLLSYEATPTPAQDGTRSRALLQIQLSF